ncbi:MAG: SWIB/MDM2 domain-containing protein [Patescibacteria group bacterium]
MAKENSAFMKPMNVSPDLAVIVGNGPMPRSEVVSKLWVYIKGHNLQDSKDKRIVKTDDALKKIFDGQDSVHMMKMAGFISKHLTK